MGIRVFDDMGQMTLEKVRDLLPMVSEQRREEALRYKHLFGQFTCLQSYVMLRQMLEELGLTHPFVFERNEHGKPFLKEHPEIHFNISHCKKGIAVAISDTPVGIDIESYRHPSESLLRHTMNDTECADILGYYMPEQRFTEYWTKKEAAFKLQSTGILRERLHDILNDDKLVIETHTNPLKRYAYSIAQNKKG